MSTLANCISSLRVLIYPAYTTSPVDIEFNEFLRLNAKAGYILALLPWRLWIQHQLVPLYKSLTYASNGTVALALEDNTETSIRTRAVLRTLQQDVLPQPNVVVGKIAFKKL